MGLHPNKLIIAENTISWKHIYFTKSTKHLSIAQPTLIAQNTYISLQLLKII